MKKFFSLLLSLLLICASVSALGLGPDYTLSQKLSLQLQSSGFIGDVTLQREGEISLFPEEETVKAICAILAEKGLHFTSMANGNERETVLSLGQEEETGFLRLITDDERILLFMEGLGENQVPSLLLKEDAAAFFSGAEYVWPSPYAVLLRAFLAQDEWKQSMDAQSAVYNVLLGTFLQQYTEIQNTENGNTRISFVIPAEDVKAQIVTVLQELYADEEMMQILQSVLSGREMTAYFNPAMLEETQQALARLEMEGELEVEREYDASGTLVQESIFLPFPQETGISRFYQSMTVKGSETQKSYSLSLTSGNVLSLSVKEAEAGHYSGDFVYSFTQEDGKEVVLAFDYDFALQQGEDTYDAESDLCDYRLEAQLSLQPQDGSVLEHATTVSFQYNLSSKSSRRSATHVHAVLNILDEETSGFMNFDFSAATATPWTSSTMESVQGEVLDIASLELLDRAALLDVWKAGWTEWLKETAE